MKQSLWNLGKSNKYPQNFYDTKLHIAGDLSFITESQLASNLQKIIHLIILLY